MKIDNTITPESLTGALDRFWELSGQKIELIEKEYDSSQGAPVFTVDGKYSTRGWTEWTEGFVYGSAFLQFDATGEERFLELLLVSAFREPNPDSLVGLVFAAG